MFTNNDFYQVVLHNTLAQNLSHSSPALRFYSMIGETAMVTMRCAIADETFDYKLEATIRQLKQNDFASLKEADIPSRDEYVKLKNLDSPTVAQTMQIRKFELALHMDLNESQQHFINTVKHAKEIKAWTAKVDYMKMRLQYTTLRHCKDTLKRQVLTNMKHQETDSINSSEFSLRSLAPFRVLELVL